MTLKKNIVAVSLFFILTGYLQSQTLTTYNFLQLDADARSSSLAGAMVSGENNSNLIFYNPAGLASITSSKASVGFYKYLLDINSGNASYSQKYKEYGYFGAGIRYMNYGTFDKYDENYNNVGSFGAYDIAVSLGYANKYKNVINYGVNLKYIQSKYDEFSSAALAMDLGVLYQNSEYQFNAGASLLNLGTQIKAYIDTKEKLPLDLRVGFSKKLEHLPLNFNLGFCKLNDDYDKFFDRFKNVIVGGEFNLSEYVDLRVGYNNLQRQNLKTGSSLGITGFSAGIGFKYQDKYFLDYGFNSLGKIGSTHRINIGFNLK